jgi:hypothetical protein
MYNLRLESIARTLLTPICHIALFLFLAHHGIGLKLSGRLHDLLKGEIPRFPKLLLINSRTPTHDVPDPSEEVSEQVCTYHRFTRHDAEVFLDPLSFYIRCGCDEQG